MLSKPLINVFILVITLFAGIMSCADDQNDPVKMREPIINTSIVTKIKSKIATGGGLVVDEAGETVIDKGLCWSTKAAPTINDYKVSAGAGDGQFEVLMESLTRDTKYFVRSFLINKNGVYYGNEVNFQTLTNPAIPFDSFWLVNRFGDNSASNNNFFNTWAELRPYQAVIDDEFYYYASVYGIGSLPNNCSKTYSKKDGLLSIKLDCSIPKSGIRQPNDEEWLDPLKYKISISVLLSGLTANEAYIEFPEYGEKIDFKAIVRITDTSGNPSLGNRLIISVYEETPLLLKNGNKLYSRIVFDEYL